MSHKDTKDTFMHFLSSKVAISISRRDKMPYQKREFPLLSEMCVQTLTQHFDKYPTLEGVDAHHKEKIYSNLGTHFPIVKMAKHVEYEPYWQKMCKEKLSMEKIPAGHSTWRSTFFSLYLQQHIENMLDPEADPPLSELVKVMAPATFRLRVDRARVSFDICDYLSKLTRLQHLRLTLVKKDARNNFNVDSLGMSMEDVNNCSNLVAGLKELKVLELPCNQIDDSGVKMLIRAMEDHPTLAQVNLSHNKISNDGARRIGRTIKKNKNILSVDLSNNKIGYEGGRCLSLVLAEPTCQLLKIDLGLNLVGDKALVIMLEDMRENRCLKELGLGANLLTDESMPAIVQFLTLNKTLTGCNLSCNKFTDRVYEDLRRCLLQNKSLEHLDLSNNDMDPQRATELAEIVTKKFLERTGISFKSTQDLLKGFKAAEDKKKKDEEDQRAAAEAKKQALLEKPPETVQGEKDKGKDHGEEA